MRKLKTLLLLDEDAQKGLRGAIIACLFTSISLMLPFAITIRLFTELMKPLSGGEVSWTLIWILFGIGILVFFFIFTLSKHDYLKTYVNSYRQSEKNRMRVAEQMRKLPMSFFNARDLAELSANIMEDCTNIETSTSNIVPQLFASLISSTIVCIALAAFDWRMALALYLMLPIAALVFYLSRRLQKYFFEQHVAAKLDAQKQAQEYLDGIKVIRACGLGGEKFRYLDDAFMELKKAAIRIELFSGSVMALSTMLLRCGIGIVSFVGIGLLSAGELDFLHLLMFLLIAGRIYGPILTVLTLLPDMLYLQVSTKRLQELMKSIPMEGSTDMPPEKTEISFEGVSFAYGKDRVLKEISFLAEEGKITALVGPSGSGKSTISKLAARFWDANEGRILLGGRQIKEIDPEILMKKFSFVFQEVTLFHDTVEENIRIGRPDATKEEIRAAAESACCAAFIEKLPLGYQTLLGENGATLSGGERQRISIARALLKDAPIVILDEATASLDPESEVFVQQAINRLVAKKTVLVIAHRLRTIINADRIIVLDKGRIIEEGSGRELLAKEGLFSRLYRIQQESLNWKIGEEG